MKYVLREIAEAVKNAIETTPEVKASGNVRAIVEDRGVVERTVQEAESKTGVAAVVAVVGHTHRASAGEALTGTVDIEIRISERPAVNRVRHPNGLTAQDLADLLTQRLHYAQLDDIGKLVYDDLRREDDGDADVVYMSMHMESSARPCERVRWGVEGSVRWGRIVTRRVSRGGTVVVEPGRSGDDEFVGVRNRHVLLDMTVEIAADEQDFIPDLDEPFQCLFKGVETTFFTTAADVTEQVADVATLHIAGRTMPAR